MDAPTQVTLSHQLPVALLWVYVLDWLKESKYFPWFTKQSEKLNRVASIVFAFLSAEGIKLALSGSLIQGGSIVIAFPPIAVLANTLLHSGSQYAAQEIIHKLLGNHLMNKQVLDQISSLSERFNPPVDPVDLPAVPLSASAPAAPAKEGKEL